MLVVDVFILDHLQVCQKIIPLDISFGIYFTCIQSTGVIWSKFRSMSECYERMKTLPNVSQRRLQSMKEILTCVQWALDQRISHEEPAEDEGWRQLELLELIELEYGEFCSIVVSILVSGTIIQF